ncbi:TPA: Arc family DNA-binding protein [Pseudomonas aeruginosa]|nr:Arc family DNA-binding protein [Pseudomonas aeruginosa]
MKEVLNPIALRALAAARVSMPVRPIYRSRTADKFVIRASIELLKAMTDLGKVQGRSANSEIICAVLESLEGRRKANVTRKVYVAYLGEEMVAHLMADVALFSEDQIRGGAKSVIRLPDGIRAAVAREVDRQRSEGGQLRSMQVWVLDALVWWINTQRVNYALLGACVSLDTDELSES